MNDDKTLTIAGSGFSLRPSNLTEAIELAKIMAGSDLVPKDFRDKPGNVLVAVQMGAEVGLSPMQAIQNIAVVNGRATVWGDASIGLVKASGLLTFIDETDDGNTATCVVQRQGEPPVTRTFSMEDAKQAGLAGKDGPWKQYPKRMRQMRARAWALRDVFPDVLKGLSIREEVQDYDTETTAQRVATPARSTIETPRRKSEADLGNLNGNAATEHVEEPATVQSCVARVTPVSGKTNGKPWTYFEITTEDGESFSTFRKSHRDTAEAAAMNHDPVTIGWKPTKKGGKEIVSIEALEPVLGGDAIETAEAAGE